MNYGERDYRRKLDIRMDGDFTYSIADENAVSGAADLYDHYATFRVGMPIREGRLLPLQWSDGGAGGGDLPAATPKQSRSSRSAHRSRGPPPKMHRLIWATSFLSWSDSFERDRGVADDERQICLPAWPRLQ
jgi:hypothetical protein